jgi:hypothetical protein
MDTSCRTNTMAVGARNGTKCSASAAFSVRAAHKSHTPLANLSSDMHHSPIKQRRRLSLRQIHWAGGECGGRISTPPLDELVGNSEVI